MIALAPHVEWGGPAKGPIGGEAGGGEPDQHCPGGNVDQERPSPSRTCGDAPARDHAERSGNCAHGAEDAQRAVAFATLAEGDGEQ